MGSLKRALGFTALFSREGGSADWVPAFAGKQAAFALGVAGLGPFGRAVRHRHASARWCDYGAVVWAVKS